MKMDGNVMKMRAMPELDLPAGKAVELKPGGYHIMLMDLKAPLAKDTQLPLTLVFKDAKGEERRMELQVPVATPPGATVARRRPWRCPCPQNTERCTTAAGKRPQRRRIGVSCPHTS
jgi:hypothetical protein